ncbi:putative transcriptional regulator [[Clostridium] sordellii]|uniref:helix-turn-helix domain-containing protein n=1 Tax=Paraclostridium sordellii TaxID=1505 RepID=UPI0005E26C7F|nr:helix-turn-helix transcriptional regulator [Paeniclostridium sordellii]CEN87322.1 putative transcriptional regulator [[Clostridium] sordellii] [Paeniclostridium sordellii]CEO06002.1 putative transcriptional regulator [[Clostridium] sordellii] [Paeniclostridium sordellii]
MIGKRIKELRAQKDVTQKELADFIGLTPKMISFYEKEERFPPHDIILKLSDFFDVSTDYLLGKSNVRDIKSNDNLIVIKENEKDVEELLEETMSQILDQKGLMLNGQIVDDNDLVLLRNAIRNGIELAKTMQKSKK